MAVHGAERIVKEVNIRVGVNGARYADTLFLTATQVDALYSSSLQLRFRYSYLD